MWMQITKPGVERVAIGEPPLKPPSSLFIGEVFYSTLFKNQKNAYLNLGHFHYTHPTQFLHVTTTAVLSWTEQFRSSNNHTVRILQIQGEVGLPLVRNLMKDRAFTASRKIIFVYFFKILMGLNLDSLVYNVGFTSSHTSMRLICNHVWMDTTHCVFIVRLWIPVNWVMPKIVLTS